MFTSRAEYRLILREDNADLRLTEKGRELGLVDDRRWAAFCAKREGIEREEQRLKSTWVRPGTAQGEAIVARFGTPLTHEYNLHNLLARPEIRAGRLICPLPQTLVSHNAYYLVMAPGHDTLGKVAAFRDWIVALVQQEEAEFDSAL